MEASRKTLTQEKEGYRIILRRNTIALMLHELVHFLNDQAFPKQPINTEPDHLFAVRARRVRAAGVGTCGLRGTPRVLEFAGVTF